MKQLWKTKLEFWKSALYKWSQLTGADMRLCEMTSTEEFNVRSSVYHPHLVVKAGITYQTVNFLHRFEMIKVRALLVMRRRVQSGLTKAV